MRIPFLFFLLTIVAGCNNDSSDSSSSAGTGTEASITTGYAIVNTGQIACYDDSNELVICPAEGEAFNIQTPAVNRIPVPAAVRDEPKPFSHYSAIAQRNLFDTSQVAASSPPQAASPSTAQVDLENLRKTELKLKLWGTVTGDEKWTYAVIEDTRARRQNLYRTGDSVQNAAVKMILRERVVLTVDGTDEILQMEKMESRKDDAKSMLARRAVESKPSQRVTLKRSQIENALQNADKLMTHRIRPLLVEGQPAGYMLTKIKSDSILRRMGLRNGDVITGIDGNEIASVDDPLKFYENLKSAPPMEIQIKRRNRKRTIAYKIE